MQGFLLLPICSFVNFVSSSVRRGTRRMYRERLPTTQPQSSLKLTVTPSNPLAILLSILKAPSPNKHLHQRAVLLKRGRWPTGYNDKLHPICSEAGRGDAKSQIHPTWHWKYELQTTRYEIPNPKPQTPNPKSRIPNLHPTTDI